MTNPWNQPAYENDDDDSFDDPNDNGQKLPNPVRKRMRELEKQNKELKEANEKALTQLRSGSIETVLKEKGFSAKVARLIPKDVEPTTEAVEKWLEDYADVFALPKAEGEGESEGETSEGEPGPEERAQQDAMGRIGKATTAGSTPGKQADLQAAIAGAKNREELLALVEKHGGGVGSG